MGETQSGPPGQQGDEGESLTGRRLRSETKRGRLVQIKSGSEVETPNLTM